MRFSRSSRAATMAAVAALALSACASAESDGDSSDGGSTTSPGGNISVAEVGSFTSFNADSATGNVLINGKVDYLTHWGFNYVDKDLNIVRNEEFGTYKVLSKDPLTVKYTVNKGVVWSDGTPIDAGDLMLAWAVESGYFDDATTNENDKVTSGTKYFAYAGSTTGLGLTDLPKIGDDGRSITMTYSKPYADWEIAFNMDQPAHVVAKGGGLPDEQALTDLITSTPEGDPDNPQKRPKLKAVADFWNTAFDTTSLPSDPSMYLSSGPFIVESMTPDRSMTLVRNEKFDWGPEPKLDEITIRYISDANAQVQALNNGEVDVIAPQATADTLSSLKEIEGINIQQGLELAFKHIDLNYSGVFEEENVRKAFMHTIPRESILNATVKQIDPDAKPRDSHLFVPGTEGYKAAVPVNGSENYQNVDIEKAKELLDGATPKVRIMYSTGSPNTVDVYTLIAESAEKAGFEVIDGGLPSTKWGAALGSGTYDATIFAWVSPGVGVTGVPQLYGCDSASNFSGFCNQKAQKLMDELILTTDPERQQEIQVAIDSILFDTGYGLPLFQSAGISAADKRVEGLAYNPGLYGVWWNVWDWSISE
ncbi:ABC transporter family substrate-binding protein [Arthrobacter monumenti]